MRLPRRLLVGSSGTPELLRRPGDRVGQMKESSAVRLEHLDDLLPS